METTVLEIHKAVGRESDLLIEENPYKNEREIARALKEMGFTSAENVRRVTDHDEHHNQARMYRQKYPQFKFITEQVLDRVMDKFDLERKTLSAFKGAIPERNATELMAIKIDSADLTNKESPKMTHKAIVGGSNIPPFLKEILEEAASSALNDLFGSKLSSVLPAGRLNLSEIGAANNQIISIVADPRLFEKQLAGVCPMVLAEVKGGFLVLSAWGAEAADPEVLNQNMN